MLHEKKTQLLIISGFLGAGKTTLLQNLMSIYNDKKIGVIMNEFGKESIDGLRIKQEGTELFEINNGSVFCSCLKGSFIDVLINCANLSLDILIIEGSGLADPSNFHEILMILKGKLNYLPFEYLGSIAIIDAVNYFEQLDAFPAIEKQIIFSNLVIVNKQDLVGQNQIKKIIEHINTINSCAEIQTTNYCCLDFYKFENILKKNEVSVNSETYNRPDNRPKTVILKSDGIFRRENLENFLKSLICDAFRIKGFFFLENGWHQIDTVGKNIEIKKTEVTLSSSKIVIISNIGVHIIRKIHTNWYQYFEETMQLR